MKINFIKKIICVAYDEKEIIHFYEQLVKMKKNRSHINPMSMLLEIYPNSRKSIFEIIKKHKENRDE